MLLKNKENGTLIKILDTEELIDPSRSEVKGKVQEGQEEQDAEDFSKEQLIFPSNENLPRCWLEANYQK